MTGYLSTVPSSLATVRSRGRFSFSFIVSTPLPFSFLNSFGKKIIGDFAAWYFQELNRLHDLLLVEICIPAQFRRQCRIAYSKQFCKDFLAAAFLRDATPQLGIIKHDSHQSIPSFLCLMKFRFLNCLHIITGQI